MGSSRFPGKPLFKILENHFFNGYMKEEDAEIDELYVTTPDKEIIDFCAQRDIKLLKPPILMKDA